MKKIKKNKINGLPAITVVMAFVFIISWAADAAGEPGTTLDPESEEFYQQAHFLMTKHERKVFKKLVSAEARQRFIQYFWEIRDPNPYADENEFKLLMDERFDYVNYYLKEGNIPGWKTDRGRIYMLLGPPDYIDSRSVFNNPYVHGYIFWYYTEESLDISNVRYEGVYILFVDSDGTGRYYINTEGIGVTNMEGKVVTLPGTDLRLLDEAEKMKYKHIKDRDTMFLENNLEFQLTYDREKESFHLSIQPEHVLFDENPDTGEMTAKFKINMIMYTGAEDFFKHTEVKSITLKKEQLLGQTGKTSPIQLDIPLNLKKENAAQVSKITVDAFISDLLGDAAKRRLFNFNIKKNGDK
jgi:GWxTD domain-containing protein